MKTLTLTLPKQKIFDAVKKAGSNLDLDIESSDLAKGRLLLYSSGGLLSFGNKVLVKITTKNGKSILKVSSSSAASFQLIDWGANKSIESDILREVKQILTR
jgi:hypothetical protein